MGVPLVAGSVGGSRLARTGRTPPALDSTIQESWPAVRGTAGGLILGSLFGEPGGGAKAGLGLGLASGLWGGVYHGIYEGEDHWEEVSMDSLRRVYCALKRTPECGYIPTTDS
jgi:hypothetical protein